MMLKNLLFGLVICVPQTLLAGPDTVGNGDSAVMVGNATMTFDVAECTEAFFPDSLGAPWTLVMAQINMLKAKLPQTAALIEGIYNDGATIWCFVTPPLRQIDDSGSTPVVINAERQQLAINSADFIRIHKDLWNKLDERSKASLLIHEMLWTAVGSDSVRDGSPIRNLTNLILNPALDRFSKENLIKFFRQFINNPRSRLQRYVELDQANDSNAPSRHFTIRQESTPDGIQDIVDVSGHPEHAKLQLTPPNPIRQLQNIVRYKHASGDSLFVDTGTHQDQSLIGVHYDEPVASLTRIPLSRLCDDVVYGNHDDWRLPTLTELNWLYARGLSAVPATRKHVYYKAVNFTGGVENLKFEVTRLYPKLLYPTIHQWNEMPYLDNEANQVLENVDETTTQRANVIHLGAAQYARYFCVRSEP